MGKAIYAIDAFSDDAQLWRNDRLEPRAIDNNKAPLPPTNDSASLSRIASPLGRGEGAVGERKQSAAKLVN